MIEDAVNILAKYNPIIDSSGKVISTITERVIHRDFIGFTFAGIHSSQLNILRVSNGNRYTQDLLPTIEDYSIDIVGGYGANYFGGFFKKREFSIDIAFENVDEQNLRAIQEWFMDRETHDLYFDECPYKVYNAVVSKTPQLKYICFGSDAWENNITDANARRYKGEGTIVFTCYDPIGYSKIGNFLENYRITEDTDLKYDTSYTNESLEYKLALSDRLTRFYNIEEWAATSRMKEVAIDPNGIDRWSNDTDIPENGGIYIYNAGMVSTPAKYHINWTEKILNLIINGNTLSLERSSTSNYSILIDTERDVILEEDDNGEETKVVLNNLITTGRFRKLEPGVNSISISGGTITRIEYYNRYF